MVVLTDVDRRWPSHRPMDSEADGRKPSRQRGAAQTDNPVAVPP